VFHYLCPSFAVLLLSSLAPPGVAWLRIASAGLIFGVWRKSDYAGYIRQNTTEADHADICRRGDRPGPDEF
jgi:threonine/homoserine efflux transporter RhtA